MMLEQATAAASPSSLGTSGLPRLQLANGSLEALKWLALLLMLGDHISHVYPPDLLFVAGNCSAAAMAFQLSTAYVRKETRPVVAVFDGDQRAIEGANFDHAKKTAENAGGDFPEWFKERCAYLPGVHWPEKWLMQRAAQKTRTLSKLLGADPDELDAVFAEGLIAGKHRELFEVAKRVGLERIQCLQMIATVVVQEFDDELTSVTDRIQQALDKG